MLIWIFVIIISLITAALFLIQCCNEKIQNDKRKFKRVVTILLLSVSILFTSILTIINASSTSIKSAERVALIYKHEPGGHQNTSLFYDEKTDEYFVIAYNTWDIFHISRRQIIDKEIAKQYVEIYNELKEYDLLNLGH